MAEPIRVVPTGPPPGTADWRAEKADGSYLCDIRLDLSARVYGSRYYVLQNDRLVKEGTFTYVIWDNKAVREVITAVVRSMSPQTNVTFEPRSSTRSAT